MTTDNNDYLELDNHVIFTYINQWENHSIAKIRLAAQQARNQVKQIFNKYREDIANLLYQINKQRETNFNSNNHLNEWMKHLTKLRQDISNLSSSIHLQHETNEPAIYLIKLSCKNKDKIKPNDQDKNEYSIDVPGTTQLTSSILKNASPSEQKQMLGERLFVLVQQIEPHLAAKITGMFLEFDIKYILILITSYRVLKEKIKEARHVLQAYRYRQSNVIQS